MIPSANDSFERCVNPGSRWQTTISNGSISIASSEKQWAEWCCNSTIVYHPTWCTCDSFWKQATSTANRTLSGIIQTPGTMHIPTRRITCIRTVKKRFAQRNCRFDNTIPRLRLSLRNPAPHNVNSPRTHQIGQWRTSSEPCATDSIAKYMRSNSATL